MRANGLGLEGGPPSVTRAASVFLVEDDLQLRELMVRALADAGHVVRAASTALEALKGIIEVSPDLVLLDLGLPDVDGTELLRMIRAVSDVPLIVATARDDTADIVAALDGGADEYLVKPFSGEELGARIRALLRRIDGTGQARVVHVGGLVIDRRTRQITVEGEAVTCTRKEFDLLAYLAARPGEVVPRQELYAAVWREPYGRPDKTIDVHLSWLRRKLGETAATPRYLHTIRGVGVKLVDPT